MTEPLLLIFSVTGLFLLGLFILTMLVLKRVNILLKTNVEMGAEELIRLHHLHESSLKEGFSDIRKELREVSSENRRELQETFKVFQDTVISRISENNNAQAIQLNKFDETIKADAKSNRQELAEGLKSFEGKFSNCITEFTHQLSLKFSDLTKQQADATQQAKSSIVDIRDTIEKQLKSIREDNTQQLNEMRKTVDEKLHDTLEKRLGESFKRVSDHLEQVHKGLGEMQSLAIGVGDLKKVLSNVKTRGILGEYQLGNILEQILSPDQYATNVATKKGSQANVEYAVKLPGKSDEEAVWLPMDSKFPLETYQLLLQAYDEADTVKIEQAQVNLLKVVENFAKDISTKYIDPPHTTDFAIMFLPVEGLFAEVLRHSHMFELLQRKYRITITGPTTLSALLNSLHMGFRTLAVQKRSSEVWKVLAEVKTEFATYSGQLDLVYKQLTTASGSLEKLKETRTRAMEKKLSQVAVLEKIDDQESSLLLDL